MVVLFRLFCMLRTWYCTCRLSLLLPLSIVAEAGMSLAPALVRRRGTGKGRPETGRGLRLRCSIHVSNSLGTWEATFIIVSTLCLDVPEAKRQPLSGK